MAIIPGEQKNSFSFNPRQQKQKNLIYILGILVLTTGVVLYFGFLKKEEAMPDPSLSEGENYPVQELMINSLRQVDFNRAILNDARFNSLSLPVKLPLTIDPSEKGRSNPFDAF